VPAWLHNSAATIFPLLTVIIHHDVVGCVAMHKYYCTQ